jgi:hypothetical protein
MALVHSLAKEEFSPRLEGEVVSLHSSPKLQTLCVGTGRDGTQSINHMIQHVLASSGDRKCMHEYCAREFSQAFCDFQETGDASYANTINQMIVDCPYDSVVGNGYAAILPQFALWCGQGMKVIHLYRSDRDACIESLVINCQLFPTAYRYYSSSPQATVKRMAAFHFGEMSHAEWDRLLLKDKFAWYYDKTHALIRQYLSFFNTYIEIATESLDEAKTRRAIADFVGGRVAATPPMAHLNASVIDIASFAKKHQGKMNWLMGRLNMEELANDDVYALDYFLNKFIAWTGYEINNAPQLDGTVPPLPSEIANNLERARRILNVGLRDVDALHMLARNHERTLSK